MPAYRPWFDRNGTRPRIGMEFEMNSVRANGSSLSQTDLRNAILAAGVPSSMVRSAGYGHNDGDVWEAKTDGSCGFEVTTPAFTLDENGDNMQVKDVCDRLKALRPRIDRRCGFHLHVEVRDFDWADLQRLIAFWVRYEPYFFEMLPPSRRGNTYCQPLRKSRWTDADSPLFTRSIAPALGATNQRTFQSAATIDRYVSLNLQHFWRSGRIEFRLHSGTVDYDKVRNWAKLILALVARVKNPDMPRVQLNVATRPEGFSTRYMFRQLGLIVGRHIREVPESNRELIVWADSRRLLFDPNAMRRPGMRTATGRRAARSTTAASLDQEEEIQNGIATGVGANAPAPAPVATANGFADTTIALNVMTAMGIDRGDGQMFRRIVRAVEIARNIPAHDLRQAHVAIAYDASVEGVVINEEIARLIDTALRASTPGTRVSTRRPSRRRI